PCPPRRSSGRAPITPRTLVIGMTSEGPGCFTAPSTKTWRSGVTSIAGFRSSVLYARVRSSRNLSMGIPVTRLSPRSGRVTTPFSSTLKRPLRSSSRQILTSTTSPTSRVTGSGERKSSDSTCGCPAAHPVSPTAPKKRNDARRRFRRHQTRRETIFILKRTGYASQANHSGQKYARSGRDSRLGDRHRRTGTEDPVIEIEQLLSLDCPTVARLHCCPSALPHRLRLGRV